MITNITIIAIVINPLNAKLNPICHVLALLGAHHILHVSRVNVSTGFLIAVVTVVTTIAGVYIFTKFLSDHYLQVHKLCCRHAGEN